MPGKHHQSRSFLARHRYPLIVAVVLLNLTVAGILAAIDNRRGPSPSPRLIAPSPGVAPSLSLVASPPEAPSAVPSRSAVPSASPTSAPGPTRPPSRRPSPAAPASPFSARYFAAGVRGDDFRAGVLITNEGRSTADWRLVITHDPDDDVRVDGTLTFTGTLGAGERTTVGYRGTTSADRTPRPASCRINGRDCVIVERRYRNESGGWRR